MGLMATLYPVSSVLVGLIVYLILMLIHLFICLGRDCTFAFKMIGI